MTKQELEQWLTNKGYHKDTYGHYQREIDGKIYRYKLQSNSVRIERKAIIVDHNEWIKLRSGYYKNLSITKDNKLWI